MNQGVERGSLTRVEVYRRAYTVLCDHQSSTAIDLRRVDGFKIVVSNEDYEALRMEPAPISDRHLISFEHLISFDRGLRIGGILVEPDEALEVGQVRLRTELEA